MERFFSLDQPFLRFVLNTLVASLLGLFPLLALYIALTPGFTNMLLDGGPALERFARQVATNGLPVVFAVNYISFFLYGWLNARPGNAPCAAQVILIDLPLRLFAFAFLHAIIYVLSADWFGSFGGSRATALRVVAPTLARSALFENISGVYLYATLVSALPLYASAIERSRTGRPHRRSLAFLLALLLFGLFALLLTCAALLVAHVQPA